MGVQRARRLSQGLRQGDVDRLNWRTAVLGFLSAVLGLVALVLGYFLNTTHDDVSSLEGEKSRLVRQLAELKERSNRDSGTISGLREHTESLEQKIDQQEEQIRSLQQQVPPVIREADVPAVRTNNKVVLAVGGDTIDLNSLEPNWGASSQTHGSDTVSLGSGRLVFGYGVSALQLPSGSSASYKTCAAASGYARVDGYGRDLTDITVFTTPRICLRLDSGRFATVRATAVDKARAELAITVWEQS